MKRSIVSVLAVLLGVACFPGPSQADALEKTMRRKNAEEVFADRGLVRA